MTTLLITHQVTDSEVNYNIFYEGRNKALLSINGDLWVQNYYYVDNKDIDLNLKWVPSHTESSIKAGQREAKGKPPMVICRRVFSLNKLADTLAELAAGKCQLELNTTTRYLYHVHLVKAIQKHFVAVIFGCGKEKFVVEPKVRFNRPTLVDCAAASSHHVVITHKAICCVACMTKYTKASPGVRYWLGSSCTPCIGDDTFVPVPCPEGQPIKVGKLTVHWSHKPFRFRGVHFCNNCGFYGSTNVRKLASPCEPDRIFLHGARALASFRNDIMPNSARSPPSVDSHIFVGGKVRAAFGSNTPTCLINGNQVAGAQCDSNVIDTMAPGPPYGGTVLSASHNVQRFHQNGNAGIQNREFLSFDDPDAHFDEPSDDG